MSTDTCSECPSQDVAKFKALRSSSLLFTQSKLSLLLGLGHTARVTLVVLVVVALFGDDPTLR